MNVRSTLFVSLVALLTAGCGGGEDDIDKRLAMLDAAVPAGGIVKIDGKPLAEVVVVYFPDEEGGAPGHGETDEEGRFSLTTASRPGAVPGKYRVTLSYLVATDGRVLGLEPRSGLVPDPAVASASEKIPPQFSNLAKTTLTAVVPSGGGEAEFHIDARIDPPPQQPPAEEPQAAEAPQP